MFHTKMPEFELQNSNILARSGETSMSHLNYYFVACFNPFIANVRSYRQQAIDFTLHINLLVSI